jgi:hypothetical protein
MKRFLDIEKAPLEWVPGYVLDDIPVSERNLVLDDIFRRLNLELLIMATAVLDIVRIFQAIPPERSYLRDT